MNNLDRAVKWRLDKAASMANTGKQVARAATLIGLPFVGGLGAGKAYSKVMGPKTEELDHVQAQYVTAKMQQAIEELEQKKKMQALKESLNGNTPTLRI